MKVILKVILIALAIFKCTSALELSKCSLEDSDCQKNFFQGVRSKYARTGIPEIGIQRLEPFDLADVELVIMQLIHIRLIEGQASGIGNCSVLSFKTDLNKFVRTVEILCNRIVIEGTYTIRSNPIVRKIFGGFVYGDGYGSIVLKDWYFKLKTPFKFVKRDDGNIYMISLHDQGTYESKVLKNIVFNADNIEISGCDIANVVLDYINRHWKLIFYTFGESFNKISIDDYNKVYDLFYSRVPATEYLSNDLTPYVTNNNCTQCV